MRMMSRVLGPAAAAAALLIASAGLAQDSAPAAGADASSAPPPVAEATLPAAGATVPATDAAGEGSATAQGAPGGAAADPHRLLDDMSGGPQGSPTAQRGNPQPGTSTSIPTTNPATIRPVEQERAGNSDIAVEDTGFEGQCDPVVSIGCPAVADQLQTEAAAGAATGTAAPTATGDAAAQPATNGAAQPAAGGGAEPAGAAN